MRVVLIAAAVVTMSLAGPVRAEPAMEHSCIAVGDGYRHIVATVTKPEDCCSGRMQCSQFLSTTTLVRPSQQRHT